MIKKEKVKPNDKIEEFGSNERKRGKNEKKKKKLMKQIYQLKSSKH